jgi:hypothetical protein
MNSSRFLEEDGTLSRTRTVDLWAWFPSQAQIRNALQLQFEAGPPVEDAPEMAPESVWYTSMRQGLGLVVVVALLAGLLPFVVNWVSAARVGTAVPLAQMAYEAEERGGRDAFFGPAATIRETTQRLAGMETAVFPGWLAAGLSALGIWVSWPLNWLTWWIVYGAVVLLVAHLLGATTTLQRFYALTSYAFLPLILLGLGPVPCLGALATVAALLWTGVMYFVAVRAATGLQAATVLASMLAPGALLILLAALGGLTVLATTVALLF